MVQVTTALSKASLDIVILTAGQSSRLGQPKQHVLFDGISLLERAASLACDLAEAIASPLEPLVISGAYLQQDCVALYKRSDQRPVSHHYNAQWRQGMAASLRCASSLTRSDGVLILQVDQLRVTLKDLMALHAAWQKEPVRAAAASYAGTIGPPVIWPRSLWIAANQNTVGNTGGYKSVLQNSSPLKVAMESAATDVDTPSDLAALKHKS